MKWFKETLHEHFAHLLTVEKLVHQSRTEHQDVMIFENEIFGRVFVLDGILQLTERDNHIYHEMIAHVPLVAHGAARNALVIGGGDGGVLREVLKHPVSEAVLVELDGEVIDLARRYFPKVSDGAFDDPRTSVVVGNGVDFVAGSGAKFDVIIVDSTDPGGPGEPLFTEAFYADCRQLLRPGGMIALQSGSAFFQPTALGRVCGRVSGAFAGVRPFLAPVPTYAGGMLALVAAGESPEAPCPPAGILGERFAALEGKTRYYTPEVHRAAFVLPPDLGENG